MFLSQVLGLYMLVMGIAVFLNPTRVEQVIKEFGKSYLIPFFDGAVALIVGLLIVLSHNDWNTPAAAVISLFGWLAVIEGVLMSLLPQAKIERLMAFFTRDSWIPVFGGIMTVLGAYLTYVGFWG